jgi:ketosteroid isomerase-like protein
MTKSFLLVVLGWILAGCEPPASVEQCSAELLDTDRAFARYSVENGPASAFERYLDTDGIQLPADAPPIFGRTEIVDAMSSGPDFGLDWEPQHAQSASACDLGWTWGTYEATFTDQEGATVVSTGKYVNVWRRLDDGSWRVVVDAGNGSGEPPRQILRTVHGNVLESAANPAATITPGDDFNYVGRFDFEIEGVATGERFVFADTSGGHVDRLFIVHFEAILPESDEIFRYSFDDAIDLGGFKFRQNPYAYSNQAGAAEKPGGEAAKTATLLRDAGLEVEDELVTSRYVMVPDEEKKHEMILFYVENLSDFERHLSDLYTGEGDETKALHDISATLDERARAAFMITTRNPG